MASKKLTAKQQEKSDLKRLNDLLKKEIAKNPKIKPVKNVKSTKQKRQIGNAIKRASSKRRGKDPIKSDSGRKGKSNVLEKGSRSSTIKQKRKSSKRTKGTNEGKGSKTGRKKGGKQDSKPTKQIAPAIPIEKIYGQDTFQLTLQAEPEKYLSMIPFPGLLSFIERYVNKEAIEPMAVVAILSGNVAEVSNGKITRIEEKVISDISTTDFIVNESNTLGFLIDQIENAYETFLQYVGGSGGYLLSLNYVALKFLYMKTK